MGNNAVAGHMMNHCGCTEALGFERSAETLISLNGIEAWPARDLVRERLNSQGELARRSRLREIPVQDGLRYIGQRSTSWWSKNVDTRFPKMVGWMGKELTRELFVQTCMDLMLSRNIRPDDRDRNDLYLIFDSMDFDGSGALSIGEWAGGLSVFFKGTQEESVHAVFETLDRDGSRTLSKSELQEYLKPFVKAMSPKEAESLRPILLKKATDDIYAEMDMDKKNDISSEELLQWSRNGNNIIEKLANIIDKEVYRIWLKQKDRDMYRNYGYSNNPGYNYNPGRNGSGTSPYSSVNRGPGFDGMQTGTDRSFSNPGPHSFPGQNPMSSQHGGPPYPHGGAPASPYGGYDHRGDPHHHNGGPGPGYNNGPGYGGGPGYYGGGGPGYGNGPNHDPHYDPHYHGGQPQYPPGPGSPGAGHPYDPHYGGGGGGGGGGMYGSQHGQNGNTWSSLVGGVSDMFNGSSSSHHQRTPSGDHYHGGGSYNAYPPPGAPSNPPYSGNSGWTGDHRNVPPPPPPPARNHASYGTPGTGGAPYPGGGGNQGGWGGGGGGGGGIPGYGGNYGSNYY